MTSVLPAQPPAPLPARRWHAVLGRGLVLLAGLAILALVGLWAYLRFFILPRIDSWREPLAAHATAALGIKVEIGHLQALTQGWESGVQMDDLRLIDRQGQVALRLPRVQAYLSWWTLWPGVWARGEVRLSKLQIEAPELSLKVDPQGRWWMAGLQLSGVSNNTPSTAPDWLLQQTDIQIHRGQVHWLNQSVLGAAAQPVLLSDVELRLHNADWLSHRHHVLELSATPPRLWGLPFSFKAHFNQAKWDWKTWHTNEPSDWTSWQGRMETTLPGADLSALRSEIELPWDLHSGLGSLHSVVSWNKGLWTQALAEVDLKQVQLRIAPHLQMLGLAQLHGVFSAQHRITAKEDRVQVQASDLAFHTTDGLAWKPSTVSLSWRAPIIKTPKLGAFPSMHLAAMDELLGGEIEASQLDLGVLTALSGAMPLGPYLSQLLASLNVQGTAQNMKLSWTGPPQAPLGYTASGEFSGLHVAAASAAALAAPATRVAPDDAGRPGIDNAHLIFQATQDGGTAQLALNQGAISFPGVFEDPRVALDKMNAQLAWTIRLPKPAAAGAAPSIELKVLNADFSNADATGHLQATWSTGPSGKNYFPGQLNLKGALTRADATKVARYMPISIPAQTRHYVEQSTLSGHASLVSFEVNGDLQYFPFPVEEQHPGVFKIAAQIEDAKFCYVPDAIAGVPKTAAKGAAAPGCKQWPNFTQLSGELVFDRNTMAIHHAQAMLGSVGSGHLAVSEVEGQIASLDVQPTLHLNGKISGDLADMLLYVQATPINLWTRHFLEQAQGSGTAVLDLATSLNLDHIDSSQVKGHLALADNRLRFSPSLPWMEHTKSQVDFTQEGLQVQANTTVMGASTHISGGSLSDGSIRVQADSSVTAQGLRDALKTLDLPAAAGGDLAHTLSTRLSGQTNTHFVLNLEHERTSWSVSSDLQGLGLNLPTPFNKAPEQSWPLRLDYAPLASSGSGSSNGAAPSDAQDALRLALSDLLQVQVVRDTSGKEARLLRAAIGVNTPARLPASGVNAQINLASLEVEPWLSVLKQPQPRSTTTSLPPKAQASNLIALGNLSVRCKSVSWSGQQLTNLKLDARPVSGAARWHVDLGADQLRGQMDWIAASQAASPAQLIAHFSRLNLPRDIGKSSDTGQEMSSDDDAPDSATNWPNMDISVDDFSVGDLKLGKLEMLAQNRDTSTGNIWQINKLSLTLPEAKLSATGQMLTRSTQPDVQTHLDFQLDVANSGSLLTRLGEPQTIKGGKGKLSGQVQWAGSPVAFETKHLSGQLHLAMESGQFLRVDTGAAKLLGVLSLQSLPRRLTLDFRDVFQQGFSFDRIDGDVSIDAGVAKTRNLRMSGVQAVVFMEGQADMPQTTQDIHVWVLPEINAGAASLAYAAINPAVGLGTFLAQLFLRKPFIEANTREFHITGPWSDPQVQRLPHRSGSTPKEATAPSSAPASSPGPALSETP